MDNHDLLEFDKLKDEQIGRLAYRDNLFYLTMLIIGGFVATYFAYRKDAGWVLLCMPWALAIIGVAYLTCERRIRDIGMYIQERLAPSLSVQTGRNVDEVFAWERYYKQLPWHPIRKNLQLATSLLLYVLSGAAAVYYYVLAQGAFEDLSINDKVFVFCDVAVISFMAVLIFAFARTRRKESAAGQFGLWKRILGSGVAAGLAGTAVIYGVPYVPPQWLVGLSALHVPVPTTTTVAICAGALVWSAGLLTGRR